MKVDTPKIEKTKKSFREPPISLTRVKLEQPKKGDYITLKCRSNAEADDSDQYELAIPYFRSGKPEEFLLFRKNFQKVVVGQGLTTGPAKYTMMRRLLDGDALAAFNQAAERHGNQTNDNFAHCMEDLTTHVFPNRALAIQRRYMRRYMRKPREMTIREYLARVNEINSYLPMFPGGNEGSKLPDDELCDILEFGIPSTWQKQMTLQAFDPLEHSPLETVEFCERLETTEEIEKSTNDTPKNSSAERATKKRKSQDGPESTSNKLYCMLHGSGRHTTEKCRSLQAKVKQMKTDYAKTHTGGNGKTSGRRQLEAMIADGVARALKKSVSGKKRKAKDDDVGDLDNFNFDLERLSIHDTDEERSFKTAKSDDGSTTTTSSDES